MPTLQALVVYFLKLGVTGFGGPVALAHYMRRDLVEREQWLNADEFDEGLAIATACPGPLAYQLGVYCGYVMHGLAGALLVALAFAAGPFLIVCGAAWAYVRFGSTWELRGLFWGIAPAVVALIFKSCWALGRTTLRTNVVAWIFAIVAFAVTVLVQKELVAVFLVAGVLGIVAFALPGVVKSRGSSASTLKLQSIAPWGLAGVPAAKIFLFFLKTGFLVFGSGLVIVPFLKSYVVDQYGWLHEQAFLDAVAIGIVSPGPVVITAAFVGYLLRGLSGAGAATVGIFAPSLVFVLIGTPILRRWRKSPYVQSFVRGVTSAVVGVLVGTSVLIALASIRDWVAAVILIVALVLLFAKRSIPEQAYIAAGGAIGLFAFAVRH